MHGDKHPQGDLHASSMPRLEKSLSKCRAHGMLTLYFEPVQVSFDFLAAVMQDLRVCIFSGAAMWSELWRRQAFCGYTRKSNDTPALPLAVRGRSRASCRCNTKGPSSHTRHLEACRATPVFATQQTGPHIRCRPTTSHRAQVATTHRNSCQVDSWQRAFKDDSLSLAANP